MPILSLCILFNRPPRWALETIRVIHSWRLDSVSDDRYYYVTHKKCGQCRAQSTTAFSFYNNIMFGNDHFFFHEIIKYDIFRRVHCHYRGNKIYQSLVRPCQQQYNSFSTVHIVYLGTWNRIFNVNTNWKYNNSDFNFKITNVN